MSAGKGDKPRNCFSKKFKDNYDAINWKGDESVDLIDIMDAIIKFNRANHPKVATKISLGKKEVRDLKSWVCYSQTHPTALDSVKCCGLKVIRSKQESLIKVQ